MASPHNVSRIQECKCKWVIPFNKANFGQVRMAETPIVVRLRPEPPYPQNVHAMDWIITDIQVGCPNIGMINFKDTGIPEGRCVIHFAVWWNYHDVWVWSWIDDVVITSYIITSVVDSHSAGFEELVTHYVDHVPFCIWEIAVGVSLGGMPQ